LHTSASPTQTSVTHVNKRVPRAVTMHHFPGFSSTAKQRDISIHVQRKTGLKQHTRPECFNNGQESDCLVTVRCNQQSITRHSNHGQSQLSQDI
ncbi:hypothetical protein BaRGS_00006682, partial [Batillaria attramentaria]